MKSRKPAEHPVPERVKSRIFDRYDVRGPDECWPWLLSVNSVGYGQVGWGLGDGRNAGTTAHRVAYMQAVGPIPDGMTVDHICRNRVCGNPAHLRLMTNVENAIRNGQGDKDRCPRGHPYDEANTYWSTSGDRAPHRQCRRCKPRWKN